MNARVRRRTLLFLPLCAALVALISLGFTDVHGFGTYAGIYGRTLTHVAVAQRHADNVVAAVVFDYRGFDTLGEEFILFAAAMGVALLLRGSIDFENQRPRDVVAHDLTRTTSSLLLPVVLLVGLWVVTFGYITPGGGFQGGVIAASALLLLWVGGGYRAYRAAAPTPVVDIVESLGAGGYVVVGLVTLGVGGYFLDNTLPLGSSGSLYSAGTIAVLNWCAALEVAGATALVFHEFLAHYVSTLPDAVDH